MAPHSNRERSVLAEQVRRLVDEMYGAEGMGQLPPSRYAYASRERGGVKYHWLVDAITDVRALDYERRHTLLLSLRNAVAEADAEDRGEGLGDIPPLQLKEQEHDAEEDMAGLIACQDPSKRRLHADRLRRYIPVASRLLAAYEAEERAGAWEARAS